MQVTVQLRPTEADLLRHLAFNERRTPKAQAAYLLARALAGSPPKETEVVVT